MNKIVKIARRKKLVFNYGETKMRNMSNFSENMQAKREQSEIFKVLRGVKTHQPRILYCAKLYSKSEGEKRFS